MSNLQKGVIYQNSNFGMLEYIRVDNFRGERTLEFRQVSDGKSRYLFPSEVEAMLAPQETIEAVRQQRDELLAAIEGLLSDGCVVMNCGNGVLHAARIAIAKAKGGAA